jgi:7-keto-8-aminopelargonate synthetase-like enzyme
MIEPEPLQQVDRTWVRFRGRRLAYFSGCDYFRLSSHPQVIGALERGVRQYGLNVAASRMTTGNHTLYRQLEERLAAFFAVPSATLVSTGYLTNLVVAQALAGDFSHVLIDGAAHPSLADAARFLECPVLRFKHQEPVEVAAAVRRCGPEAKLILLTDGVFAHDGSAAPLVEYLKVLPTDAWLLVDDAHGAGVLGQRGRGTPEHAGVSRRRIIQTVTLSKAFGTYGGAVLGPERLRQSILARSHLFIGSTPLPLPLANAALRAVALLQAGGALKRRLESNQAFVTSALRRAGMSLPAKPGPIVGLSATSPQASKRVKAALRAAGIFPPFTRYPGGAANGYFRFVISSEHTRAQLESLVSVLTGPCASLLTLPART